MFQTLYTIYVLNCLGRKLEAHTADLWLNVVYFIIIQITTSAYRSRPSTKGSPWWPFCLIYFYKQPIEALHLIHTYHIVNLQTGKNYWLTFCVGNSTGIFVSEGVGGYFINEFVNKVLHLQSAKEPVPTCRCSSRSPPYRYKQYSLSTYELWIF